MKTSDFFFGARPACCAQVWGVAVGRAASDHLGPVAEMRPDVSEALGRGRWPVGAAAARGESGNKKTPADLDRSGGARAPPLCPRCSPYILSPPSTLLGDIKKAKEAGYHTVKSMLMNTKRVRRERGEKGRKPAPSPLHPSSPPLSSFSRLIPPASPFSHTPRNWRKSRACPS